MALSKITTESLLDGEITEAKLSSDFYAEGTWTPQLSDGTNDMTMSGSNGRYTKIGRVVYITSFVQTSSLGSASGNIQLDDLPFTSSSASSSSSGLHCSRGIGLAVTASVQVSAHILTNNTSCPLYTWDGTDGSSAMQASEWTADGACFFSGFYFV
jgi:hypothetical protein